MRILAKELLKVAKEVVSKTIDLADIRAVLPEFREKRKELKEKFDAARNEYNMLYGQASADLESKTTALLEALRKEIIYFFDDAYFMVRKAELMGGLLEVYLGDGDGYKRVQSKVSVHIAMSSGGSETYSYMLRNEDLATIEGKLSDIRTVDTLMKEIRAHYNKGFWSGEQEPLEE